MCWVSCSGEGFFASSSRHTRCTVNALMLYDFSGEFGVRMDMRTRGGNDLCVGFNIEFDQLPDAPCVLCLVFTSMRPLLGASSLPNTYPPPSSSTSHFHWRFWKKKSLHCLNPVDDDFPSSCVTLIYQGWT